MNKPIADGNEWNDPKAQSLHSPVKLVFDMLNPSTKSSRAFEDKGAFYRMTPEDRDRVLERGLHEPYIPDADRRRHRRHHRPPFHNQTCSNQQAVKACVEPVNAGGGFEF